MPGSTLNYYRLDIKNEYYQPLFGDFIFKAASRVGYTGAYGDTKIPPYFENFYAGGPYSVKGYETNSLGPRLHQFHVMSMILKTITARHYWIQILMAFLKHHIITNMQHTESTDRSEECSFRN
ncbi:MAG: hypothetical protein CM15mP31_3610 [Gammaproteobacteria bacterium]|nr:MAG: hypothetical protein CM15mP31_3610 [Gammaproteobacteria bacterium]